MLEEEAQLINSVTETWQAAAASASGLKASGNSNRKSALETVSALVARVASQVRATAAQLAEAQKLEASKGELLARALEAHTRLVEAERRHFKAVKDFQEECQRNEAYSKRLHELTAPAQPRP